MYSMMKGGVLSKEEFSKKLMCVGANGMNVFQVSKIGVTK
jgi:hypothetical protein